jgi:transposase
MNLEDMERWVHDAKTKESHERRLAIWWTAHDRRNANEIAALLQVSARTVRRWIRLFNNGGPEALEIVNLGGRHWAYLSEAEELAVLASLRPPSPSGSPGDCHRIARYH